MMILENHRHRFAEALRWGKEAAKASVNGEADPDAEIVSGLTEAHLGLGEREEAARLTARFEGATEDYYGCAALGQVHAAIGRTERAVAAFERAAAVAAKLGFPKHASWAELRAARALAAAGKTSEAREHLDRATALDAGGSLYAAVAAELELAEHRPHRALEILEAALAHDHHDAELHRRAFVAAKQLGDATRARTHFRAAERLFRAPIAAGEIFTLGALAQLYLDAEVKLDEARELARRNLLFKRDGEATATAAALGVPATTSDERRYKRHGL